MAPTRRSGDPVTALGLVVAFGLATLGAPLAAHAQSATRMPRVGVLVPSTPAASAHQIEAFKQWLREHRYVDGQNIVVDFRYGEGKDERLAELTAELVRTNVDVIVAVTDRAVQMAKQHTRAIPIVMVLASDPVGAGFVVSLARPGGNVTGVTVLSPELSGKRLGLLKEAVPTISRVAFVWMLCRSLCSCDFGNQGRLSKSARSLFRPLARLFVFKSGEEIFNAVVVETLEEIAKVGAQRFGIHS